MRPIRFVVGRPAISARPTQPQRPPERLTPFSGKCAFALPFYSCICGEENACRRRLPCKRKGGGLLHIHVHYSAGKQAVTSAHATRKAALRPVRRPPSPTEINMGTNCSCATWMCPGGFLNKRFIPCFLSIAMAQLPLFSS